MALHEHGQLRHSLLLKLRSPVSPALHSNTNPLCDLGCTHRAATSSTSIYFHSSWTRWLCLMSPDVLPPLHASTDRTGSTSPSQPSPRCPYTRGRRSRLEISSTLEPHGQWVPSCDWVMGRLQHPVRGERGQRPGSWRRAPRRGGRMGAAEVLRVEESCEGSRNRSRSHGGGVTEL